MKKYALLLVWCLIVVNTQATTVSSIVSTIKKWADTCSDNFVRNEGTGKLSAQKEAYIRSIIQELGMSKNIDIRKMNKRAVTTLGVDNAFVTAPLIKEYLFVSEDFFDNLTESERRFLIGHELMHLYHKHNHLQKILIGACFVSLVPVLAGIDKLDQWMATMTTTERRDYHTISNEEDIMKLRLCAPLCILTVWSLATKAASGCISQIFERQADISAARKLNTAQGGIDLFKRSNAKNIGKIRVPSIFSSHPTPNERITALESVLIEQNKEKYND